jgi:hypothetical protein
MAKRKKLETVDDFLESFAELESEGKRLVESANGNKKANSNLNKAQKAKNDEFYTQFPDIEREMNAYLEFDPDVFRGKTILMPCDDPEWSNFTKYFVHNFARFGIKKLISTSYAAKSKPAGFEPRTSDLELKSSSYDPEKTARCGKIFTLTDKKSLSKKLDVSALDWRYLNGDGDFRSDEIKSLRDEADIIITNPPFSLFGEFLDWIIGANKKFAIIGNLNALSRKDVFTLIKDNRLWLGHGFHKGNAYFSTPYGAGYGDGVYNPETGLVKFRNVLWFTNIDHGRRHEPMVLMDMKNNLRFSKHKEIKGQSYYLKYDNYDAIEVCFPDAIPSDYEGMMGVSITFLNTYCPDQFEIIGLDEILTKEANGKTSRFFLGGVKKYARIVIRKIKTSSGGNQ